MKGKTKIWIVLVILASCIVLYLIQSKRTSDKFMNRKNRLQEISTILEITPEWEEIEEFVDCEILVVGNSKTQILVDLRKIGEIDVSESQNKETITIFFKEGFLHSQIGRITVRFDNVGELVGKNRTYDLGDPKDEYCP